MILGCNFHKFYKLHSVLDFYFKKAIKNWTREAGSQSSNVFIRFPLTDCKVAEDAFQLVAFHHSNDLGVAFVEESSVYSNEWKLGDTKNTQLSKFNGCPI